MSESTNTAENTRRPHFDRLAQIIKAHLMFARERPQEVERIARRLGTDRDSVLAVAIADQIVEEFDLVPRAKDEPSLKLYP